MGFLDRFRRSSAGADNILERVLLVPTPETGEEPGGPEILDDEREISFVLVRDQEGLPVLPAFTSEDALLRWNPQGSPYVGLEGKTLVEILAGSDWDRLVVDTADPDPFAITRSDARSLLRSSPVGAPAGSTIRIGEPAQPPPQGLVEALRRACEHESLVAEAYLYQLAIVERDDTPHLAIGLRLDSSVEDGEAGDIAQRIGEAVDPRSWGYEFVDFHVLEGEMLDTVRAAATAVFRRDHR